MLRKLFKKIKFCGRVFVVVFALLAMGVSGAGAAQRLFAPPIPSHDQADSQSSHNELVPGPSPETAPDGMADNGRPWTEPSACIQTPMLLVNNSYQLRAQALALRSETISVGPHLCSTNSCLPATSCRVYWLLGRQFTLLGAKPSGTS